jgi:hypothetical protein
MDTLPIGVGLLLIPDTRIYTSTPPCIAQGLIFLLSEISSSHDPSLSWFTDKTLTITDLVKILGMDHHLVQIYVMAFLGIQIEMEILMMHHKKLRKTCHPNYMQKHVMRENIFLALRYVPI